MNAEKKPSINVTSQVKLQTPKVMNTKTADHGVNSKAGIFDPFGFSKGDKFGQEQVRKAMMKK